MANNKKYWAGLDELHDTEAFREASQKEFSNDAHSVDEFLAETDLSKTTTNRRDFLKFLGFSVTAATVAACETPVINSIPYVNKPEQITAGVPTYYASTFYDGYDFANIVVKTREGRPIFLKGNRKHGITQGAITARVNSSVLNLYDSTRLKNPKIGGKDAKWADIDTQLGSDLKSVVAQGKPIVFFTGTIISPSTQEVIKGFKTAMGEDLVKVVSYDPVSRYGIRKANEMSFGKSFIPDYDFSKARTIVSVGADFMDNWLFHNQYVPQYAKNRNPENEWMSKHYQFESNLSLAGSNADVRVPILPSQEGRMVLAMYNEVAKLAGASSVQVNTDGLPEDKIKAAAADLYKNRGKSLFICGNNNPNIQVVANAINSALGNYGGTISTDVETFINQGNDEDVAQLVADMNSGKVGALIVNSNINPAYSLPNSDAFIKGLASVDVTVSFSGWEDETASRCKYICPDSHYLESWNDYYPKTGHSSIAQPTITRLYDTRQFQDSLLTWSGNTTSYHDVMRKVWHNYSSSVGDADTLFDDFWYNAVRNGSVSVQVPPAEWTPELDAAAVQTASSKLNGASGGKGDYELLLYTKVGIGNGAHGTNPWLQELPDPISKVTWDNYIAMNPADAESFGFNIHYGQDLPASLAKITINGKSETLPVVAQPGQKRGSVSVALGYGRGANEENIGRAAYRTKQYGGYEKDENGKKIPIGKNFYPYVSMDEGFMDYKVPGVTIEAVGEDYPIACTQTQYTVMGRDSIVRETSFATFKSAPKEEYNPEHTIGMQENGKEVEANVDKADLWAAHPIQGVGHSWGMNIDLSSCIGCNACVTSCHSENNVAVVGKDEVRRWRDMHWLRIDRYYSSDMTDEIAKEEGMGKYEKFREMEIPTYENPSTVFMPMMCQHCGHAPCETVCPVAATTHSDEGLNMMTYNRCIGTRYCANNCPFKVRRFNWFNYKAYEKFTDLNPSQDVMGRMVLNPDVTVRSRGVMEKCSMCVQRIQAGKLDAKMKGTPVPDGSIETACAEACPTHAITFGDMNDSKSEAAIARDNKRTYHALAEIGIKPNVSYKVKVRNT